MRFVMSLFILTASFASHAAVKTPIKLTIDDKQISFNLVPNEIGPEWTCWHKPVNNLPNDWRVYCQSTSSTMQLEFLVHFLLRMTGPNQSSLEMQYLVDEIQRNEKGLPNGNTTLSHGQTSLIGLTDSELPQKLILGQLVQNGTSILNIEFNANTSK